MAAASPSRATDHIVAYYESVTVYDGIDAPVLAIQVEQSTAMAADLASRGSARDTINLALRWIRGYDDVSRHRGIEAATRDRTGCGGRRPR